MSTESQIDANRQNALHHGLTTAGDFIPADECEEFIAFTAHYHACLSPVGIAEQSCMLEVRSAAWRLRRCRALEAALPLSRTESDIDQQDATIKSIERARAHAHNITRKAMFELRRLQAERKTQTQASEPPAAQSAASTPDEISFCKNEITLPTDATGPQLVPAPPRIPRGGLCPCHSGRKYKRCCGKDAPPVLHKGSRQAA